MTVAYSSMRTILFFYRYSSNIKDLENVLNEWSVENSYEAESKQAYT